MKEYPQIAQISTDFVEEDQDSETYQLIGAAMDVHRNLGPGFLERVYQLAFIEELKVRAIDFEFEVKFPVLYKGRELDCTYRADFVCYDSVIVEFKALDRLLNIHSSQLINYLKASDLKRGLLVNFGRPSLEFKRFVY